MGTGSALVELDVRSRVVRNRPFGGVPVRARGRPCAACDLGAPVRLPVDVRRARGADGGRQPTRLPPARARARRNRGRALARRPQADRACRDRCGHGRDRGDSLAPLSRRRPLPVFVAGAHGRVHFLPPRRLADLARGASARPPLAVHHLSGRLPGGFRHPPLARGWFRQNDFPQNRLLYRDDELPNGAYLQWLRSLGVRYVVLTDAPPDYSARAEASLLRSGRSGLTRVMKTRHLSIYEVPSPRELITGPAPARIVKLTQTQVSVHVAARGTYRLAVRYSPYWSASSGCLDPGKDSMIRLQAAGPGRIALTFRVNTRRALAALQGKPPQTCTR